MSLLVQFYRCFLVMGKAGGAIVCLYQHVAGTAGRRQEKAVLTNVSLNHQPPRCESLLARQRLAREGDVAGSALQLSDWVTRALFDAQQHSSCENLRSAIAVLSLSG